MVRYNLHDKFVLAITAIGGIIHAGRTRKYTEFRVPLRESDVDAVVYVGHGGAVRVGKLVSRSRPLDPRIKAKLLARANALIADEQAGGKIAGIAAAEIGAKKAAKIAAEKTAATVNA